MRETTIYGYYAFGYNYNRLRFQSMGIKVTGDSSSLDVAIDRFFDWLLTLDLKVTLTAADELMTLRKSLDSYDDNTLVDEELAGKIEKACATLDKTLDSELILRTAFIVTPKRFDLEHLQKRPSALFATGVFESLPTMCQFDLTEAGRCIAFARPTAAAFHTMRGVEGVLRHYYCSIVKRGRVPNLLWNPMIEHFRKRQHTPPKPVLDHLDNIRINFRNPTQHPDARYDMDEAQDLLAVSIEAINRMNRDLSKRRSNREHR